MILAQLCGEVSLIRENDQLEFFHIMTHLLPRHQSRSRALSDHPMELKPWALSDRHPCSYFPSAYLLDVDFFKYEAFSFFVYSTKRFDNFSLFFVIILIHIALEKANWNLSGRPISQEAVSQRNLIAVHYDLECINMGTMINFLLEKLVRFVFAIARTTLARNITAIVIVEFPIFPKPSADSKLS
jgi:hypothetical protein